MTQKSNAVVAYIKQDAVAQRIEELLKDRSAQFTTSLITAINTNAKLAACEPQSVLTAALTAASMDLPVNQNLGFAYLIPYSNGKSKKTECQFQMGYKGFIQLAIRSGYYRLINVSDVREGELIKEDRLTGELEFDWLPENERSEAKVVGYVAYFKLLTGFEKAVYWSLEEVEKHAHRYSKNFAKYGSGLWKDDFDAMAKKTVLKNLISKFGPLSTQLQEAIVKDQAVDGEYKDNPTTVVLEDAEMGASEEDVVPTAEEVEEAEVVDEPF